MIKTLSRIDHCIVNGEWLLKYVENVIQYLNLGISDHCPLLLEFTSESMCGRRPFSFFNHMVNHHEFLNTVERIWKGNPTSSMKHI